jgi:drug/metabolite transporter (DMT)-like permease
MLTPELSAVILGSLAALSWGTGDFSGGLASRKTNLFLTIAISQLVGLVLLIVIALWIAEPLPVAADLMLGVLAGLVGTAGLATLYAGLVGGKMGIAAPLAAVISAAIPVGLAAFLVGLPSPMQTAGLVIGLFAIWFLSGIGLPHREPNEPLWQPFLAGFGFAAFYIIIDQVSIRAVFWPLVAARSASAFVMVLIVLWRGYVSKPSPGAFKLMVVTGIFEAGGNAFYALAARAGRLDIAVVLSSLFPAATVLLARIFIQERLNLIQIIGVVMALLALLLIAL